MKKKLLFFSFIIIILININNCVDYPPDKFLSKDIFFDDNDQNNYIVALKYFAINSITPYLYITGLNLDKETSCFSNISDIEKFDGYSYDTNLVNNLINIMIILIILFVIFLNLKIKIKIILYIIKLEFLILIKKIQKVHLKI